MRLTIRIAPIVLCLAALSGCISTKSYVDPQYRHASYGDLARPAPPYTLRVNVEFQRNGVARPAADAQVRADIERSLRASGVAVPYDGKTPAEGELSFVLNNVANVGAAAGKGFGTGLTFGLAGSHVTDGYQMTVRLTQGTTITERVYSHAIHSTVGNASGPPGLTPVSLGAAFNQVIDDLVLNALKDLQAAGLLSPTRVAARSAAPIS
jgi:hypothetical protein